ncbi:MAG TPA: hypothetical protein VFT34_04565 [Verrucomicrobiae bacterium]|nr:hypothetical protein [Verrucomicrobiae bacterium]
MSKQSLWIEEAILGDGAFLLLASSSVSHYMRMAAQLAHETALRNRFESGLVSLKEMLNRAKELRARLAAKKQRDLEEVELAIIVAICSETPSEAASELLVELSLNDQPPLTWISALARRLFQERAANILATETEAASDKPEDEISEICICTSSDTVGTESFSVLAIPPTSVCEDSLDSTDVELAA